MSLLLAHEREWDRPAAVTGLGNLEVGSLALQVRWLGLCSFHHCLFHFNFNSCWRQHLILTFSDLPGFSAFCWYSGEMGMWFSAKCQGLFLESWQHRCFICTRAIGMRHSYSETLAETDRHSSCHGETSRQLLLPSLEVFGMFSIALVLWTCSWSFTSTRES